MGNDLTTISTQVMTLERELVQRMDLEECDQAAWTILGAYPNANIPDEKAYIRSLRELFLHFPASVVAAVASPRTGIVTRCKFPPTMAEVQEFADPMIARMQTSLTRDRQAVKQIEGRDKPITDEERQARVARLKKVVATMRAEKQQATERQRQRFAEVQCPPGDAIRAHHGWDKPTKGLDHVPEPETDGGASDSPLDSPSDVHGPEPDRLRQEPGDIPRGEEAG